MWETEGGRGKQGGGGKDIHVHVLYNIHIPMHVM